MHRKLKSLRFLGVALALVMGVGALPSGEANPYHSCLYGCNEQLFNQIDDTCHAWSCRLLPGCTAYCLKAASWLFRNCVGGCMADFG